jgi:hypothetical protein
MPSDLLGSDFVGSSSSSQVQSISPSGSPIRCMDQNRDPNSCKTLFCLVPASRTQLSALARTIILYHASRKSTSREVRSKILGVKCHLFIFRSLTCRFDSKTVTSINHEERWSPPLDPQETLSVPAGERQDFRPNSTLQLS